MRILAKTLILAVLAAGVASAQTSSGGTLSGKMAPMNYVLSGTWNCVANVPAMNGKPAHTVNSTATFDVVPTNVVHVHIASPEYNGDQYFGYATQANMYWSATSDSMGGAAAQTSADGKTYKGTMSMGPMSGTETDTYTKVSDTKVTIHSVTSLGGKTDASDINCTKS